MKPKRQFDRIEYGSTEYGLTKVKKAPLQMFDLVLNMPFWT